MVTLQSRINAIAATFVSGVLDAVRATPLHALMGGEGNIGNDGTARASWPHGVRKMTKTGRLPRRSPEEIAKTLAQIVALVKKEPDGLRAEQIRTELGLQSKEMPRALKEGLARKVLKSRGRKRATTYFVR